MYSLLSSVNVRGHPLNLCDNNGRETSPSHTLKLQSTRCAGRSLHVHHRDTELVSVELERYSKRVSGPSNYNNYRLIGTRCACAHEVDLLKTNDQEEVHQ